ncbi:hypothetical protein HPB48_005697 [Haemaphysalis longicornis]|uniref:Uncharacterized protein n=1 Tax=Haemaphysalis longicornis TaxID=44386 RepID=A0A9J6H014_HAELO|nr:hypothetical protein HPB48_005697 [Haemaphysalis longicornis]
MSPEAEVQNICHKRLPECAGQNCERVCEQGRSRMKDRERSALRRAASQSGGEVSAGRRILAERKGSRGKTTHSRELGRNERRLWKREERGRRGRRRQRGVGKEERGEDVPGEAEYLADERGISGGR